MKYDLSPIQHMISFARDLQLLTKEEEYTLIEDYQVNNNSISLDKLVRHNTLYAVAMISKYANNKKIVLEDLLQAALIGLIRGVVEFDLTKNTRLLTYATSTIRSEISKYLFNDSNIVRIPYHIHAKNGVCISPTCEISTNEFDHAYDSKSDLEFYESRMLLNDIINDTLNSNEMFIITSFFGLNGSDTLLLNEVGRTLGINTQSIYRIKRNALLKLRNAIIDNDLEDEILSIALNM